MPRARPGHGLPLLTTSAAPRIMGRDTSGMTATSGTMRADRRTKNLVKRLRPGDIAVIHHADLDATAARALVECRPAAVVNAVRSISGRYPNRGPEILLAAGIPVLDEAGEALFESALAEEGTEAVLSDGCLRLASGASAEGVPLTLQRVAAQLEEARQNLSRELDAFARNTLHYLAAEKGLLLDPLEVPELDTAIRGRHVLIVVRGEGYKEDLRAIVPYLDDVRPVLMAVDGGADALLEMGLKPHLIVGDMDSVSDRALACGAEIVVHGYAGGDRAIPGLERVRRLGLQAKVFHAAGTSEDIAMVLADEKGASVIVAVGAHYGLEDFLDKGRGGMASTFLVRLRLGSKLVDARGIGRLWAARNRPATRELVLLGVAALFPVVVVAASSPWIRTLVSTFWLSLRSTFGVR